jgi:hypothetical protein
MCHGQELGPGWGDKDASIRAEADSAVAALRERANRKVACGTRAAYAAAGELCV